MRSLVLVSVALMGLLSPVLSVSICSNPSAYAGEALCDPWGGYCGQCVSFIKVCTGDHRATGSWVKGRLVKGSSLQFGTAIATFPDGENYSGHAAIYVGQDSTGIQVWDQWVGHPVSQRTIRFGGSGVSNDGNGFYVIE